MINKFKKTALSLGILLSTVLGNTIYGMENDDDLANNQTQNQNYFQELPMEMQKLIVEIYVPFSDYKSLNLTSKHF